MPTPTPQENVITLGQRVLYLTGRVARVQAELQILVQEDGALERRIGVRPGQGISLGTVLLSVLPFTGVPLQWYRGVVGEVGEWPTFDRRWAERLGPQIRELGSAVARFEEFEQPSWRVVPPGREQAFVQKIQEGNRACLEAVRILGNWLNTPMARFDTRNNSTFTRWTRRLFTEQSQLVAARASIQGRPISETSQGTATATGKAIVTGTSGPSGGGSQTQQALERPDPTQGPPGPGGMPILVTLLLLAVGGGLVYLLIKGWLAKKE